MLIKSSQVISCKFVLKYHSAFWLKLLEKLIPLLTLLITIFVKLTFLNVAILLEKYPKQQIVMLESMYNCSFFDLPCYNLRVLTLNSWCSRNPLNISVMLHSYQNVESIS